MTYWIKNISLKEQPRITCYKNGKDLKDRNIKHNEVIEVVAEYYKDNPMIWKVVDKPKPRYLTNWAVGIGCAIIGIIGTLIVQSLTK